jgi:hypothetical protein
MEIDRDLRCETRDGTVLAASVYRPDDEGPHPALLTLTPYGKAVQEMTLFFPPQDYDSPLWYGGIEAGDTAYLVDQGYAHVIADCRGTGDSEGTFSRFLNEGEDGYDLVEWIADQPWCDGHVGMVGRSFMGTVQLYVAAERPPSLVGIFPSGTFKEYDGTAYHGGILNLFSDAWYHHVPDSEWAFETKEALSTAAFEERLETALSDPDLRNFPKLYMLLSYPDENPLFVDRVLNDTYSEFYRKREVYERIADIECPVYISGAQKGMHAVPTYEFFKALAVEEKRALLTPPKKLDRPYHEYMKEAVRWFDYLIEGDDPAFATDPPVKQYVSGAERWRFETELSPARAVYRPYYLRHHGRLAPEPEALSSVPPSSFVQEAPAVSATLATRSFRSDPVGVPLEVNGPIELRLFAAIDSTDTTWMGRLRDVGPGGDRRLLSRAYLKASFRAVDERRSREGWPRHPLTDPEPVVPGEVTEYRIAVHPVAHVFQPGHRIELELRSTDLLAEGDEWLLESQHLPRSETVAHELHHSAEFPSRLVLPIVDADSTDADAWIDESDRAYPAV